MVLAVPVHGWMESAFIMGYWREDWDGRNLTARKPKQKWGAWSPTVQGMPSGPKDLPVSPISISHYSPGPLP